MLNEVSNSAVQVIRCEMEGLAALEAALERDSGFPQAIRTMLAASRVIVTGMGKSGHIGQKVAATLSSTGTPAFFIHPAEAGHGDLGMITSQDALLAFSWSGETVELEILVTYAKRFKVPLIAVTSSRSSALGRAADIVIHLPPVKEACPLGLTPTTSTLVELAVGDCLALALLEARDFTTTDFHARHPSGKLGARLKHVSEIMHTGDALPLALQDVTVGEALVTMTKRAMGCVGIIRHDKLIGIVTDGDLRRHLDDPALLLRPVGAIMTHSPKTIAPDTLAGAALELMNAAEITALFVVESGQPVGIIHIHDLLRIGVC